MVVVGDADSGDDEVRTLMMMVVVDEVRTLMMMTVVVGVMVIDQYAVEHYDSRFSHYVTST